MAIVRDHSVMRLLGPRSLPVGTRDLPDRPGVKLVGEPPAREPLRIVLVGAAGECATEKILPALNAHVPYEIVHTIDPRPEEEVRRALRDAHLSRNFLHDRDGGLLEIINPNMVDMVIEAAPSRYRAGYATLALERKVPIYLEKPLAVGHADLSRITQAIRRNASVTAYCSEYYGLEKGIAMHVLTGDIRQGGWHEREGFFAGGIDPRLAGVLDSIGNITGIVATTLEGEGKKSGISHRLWVGDKDQGGQLLDMSTHLFTFLPMLERWIGSVNIERVRKGLENGAEAEYREKTGSQIAETYAEVYARSTNGTEIIFAFGKYTGVAERIFKIRGEHGVVSLDFETQVMSIESPAFTGAVQVVTDPKYTILMNDFVRRVVEPGLNGEYNFRNSRDTMLMIFEARSLVGGRSEEFHYNSGTIPGIEEVLERQRRL